MLVIGDVRLGTFLLVTNQRSVEIRGMGNKEIEHADVAEIGLGTSADQGDTVVSIVSQSALLDYRPTDRARFEKIIVFEVPLPRTGAQIRSEIEAHMDST